MNHIRNWMNWPALVLLVALVCVIGYRSDAEPSINAPRPLSAAVINLETVYEQLRERGDADTALQNLAEQLDAEILGRREEIEVMNTDLELHPEGSAQYLEAADRILRTTYEFDEHIELARRRLDQEKARIMRRIYRNIKDAAQSLAMEMGYDTIFVDDSIIDLPQTATEAEINRQISGRRMIWTSQEIDISAVLIKRMNDAYAAGS